MHRLKRCNQYLVAAGSGVGWITAASALARSLSFLWVVILMALPTGG